MLITCTHPPMIALRQALSASDRPDAFFCATDILAMALLDCAKHEMGLSVPEDIQVIGYDDTPQASWLSYQLTTFKQDFNRLAKDAVKILLQKINENDPGFTRLMIPAELIKRKTTR